jgi:hypothetical protein
MSINVDERAPALSELLSEITVKLQLDETRYERAASSYRAVGQYLENATPPDVGVSVYSQGSMRLQTTVKPRRREEFDLDIVAELARFPHPSPRAVYDWGLRRLRAHLYYSTILVPKNRCIRLNYAGDYHLDVLFALLDPSPMTDDTSILVPDRKLRDFTPSNPNGFADWFERQCAYDVLMTKRSMIKAQAPLPNNDPAHHRALLKQVIQLIKRARDIYFGDDEDATRSIILTTLAAQQYLGEGDLYTALVSVLERIMFEIDRAQSVGLRLVVRNPTNNLEDFSEAWDEKPAGYGKFVVWIGDLLTAVRALPELRGTDLDDALMLLFGEIVREAREAVTKRIRDAIQAGTIRSVGPRLTSVAGAGIAHRPHKFYGDGEA